MDNSPGQPWLSCRGTSTTAFTRAWRERSRTVNSNPKRRRKGHRVPEKFVLKGQAWKRWPFPKALEGAESRTPQLLGAHLGNRLVERRHQLRMVELMTGASNIEPRKLDQIAALPLSAGIKIDPWSDRVELMQAKPIALVSPWDKMPFEVTLLIPHLTRYGVSRPEQQTRR